MSSPLELDNKSLLNLFASEVASNHKKQYSIQRIENMYDLSRSYFASNRASADWTQTTALFKNSSSNEPSKPLVANDIYSDHVDVVESFFYHMANRASGIANINPNFFTLTCFYEFDTMSGDVIIHGVPDMKFSARNKLIPYMAEFAGVIVFMRRLNKDMNSMYRDHNGNGEYMCLIATRNYESLDKVSDRLGTPVKLVVIGSREGINDSSSVYIDSAISALNTSVSKVIKKISADLAFDGFAVKDTKVINATPEEALFICYRFQFDLIAEEDDITKLIPKGLSPQDFYKGFVEFVSNGVIPSFATKSRTLPRGNMALLDKRRSEIFAEDFKKLADITKDL